MIDYTTNKLKGACGAILGLVFFLIAPFGAFASGTETGGVIIGHTLSFVPQGGITSGDDVGFYSGATYSGASLVTCSPISYYGGVSNGVVSVDLDLFKLLFSYTGTSLYVATFPYVYPSSNCVRDVNNELFIHTLFDGSTFTMATPPQNAISINNPYDGYITTATTTSVDISWTASTTDDYILTVISPVGDCNPVESLQSSTIKTGSMSFTCPVDSTPTPLQAFLATVDFPLLESNKVTVYKQAYVDAFGYPATTTFDVMAVDGCKNATCSIMDISGCFKTAMCWAFVPPAGSVPPWNTLGEKVGKKPPFGYIKAFNAGLSGVTITGATNEYNLMTTQTKNDFGGIFNPLRLGLGWVFWFMGLAWLYNRAKNIQV